MAMRYLVFLYDIYDFNRSKILIMLITCLSAMSCIEVASFRVLLHNAQHLT